MRGFVVLGWMVLTTLTWGHAPARAEEPEAMANRALAMFQQEARRTEALRLFHDALDAAQGPLKTQIIANLGKAYGSAGRHAEAWAYLTWAVQRDPSQEPELRDALAFVTDVLQTTHARVRIETQPADATLRFGDATQRLELPAPFSWWIDATPVTVTAQRAGYVTRRESLSSRGPAKVVLALTPEAAPVVSTAPTSTPPAPAAPRAAERHVAPWKWWVLGAGGAVVLAGVGTFGGAMAKASQLNGKTFATRPEYDDAWSSDVTPLATASYVLWGVGGAAALTGGVLVLLDVLAPSSRSATHTTIVPLVGHGMAGAAFGGTF